jgi:hypothetical protein
VFTDSGREQSANPVNVFTDPEGEQTANPANAAFTGLGSSCAP